jgi:GNAT superfamily N-acetyltransferase
VSDETVFTTPQCWARYLRSDDGPIVQALLEQCADYFELVSGLPPGPAEAHSLFTDLPPDKTYADKILIGLFDRSAALSGVLDAVRDYPEPSVWHISLLLLDPDHRRHGRGAEVYRAFENWSRSQGAHVIRLGVFEQNEKAQRFWQRMGFTEIERVHQNVGALDEILIVMRRSL